MFKFLAMLKDSYREAVDGWIFFLLMILGGILILLVGSSSFVPVEPEVAIPRMVNGEEMRYVHADRGKSTRIGLFMYIVNSSDIQVGSRGKNPWETEVQFTYYMLSPGFGPAGVEVDDPKAPKDVKKIEGGGLFSDPFKEAARYWAKTPGSLDTPKYTDELGIEFLTYQLTTVAGLKVKSIEILSPGKFNVRVTGATSEKAWLHKPSLFFGLVPISFYQRSLGQLVYRIESTLVNNIGAWVLLLTGVVVTAGFIPNMLRKGTIDLWLTKPLSRVLVLLYKYLGGLLFVFLLTAFTITGIWLVIGLRTGIWSSGLLVSVFAITFYFAILYACSTLIGVLTRNIIVSIVVTMLFWCTLFLIGFGHNMITAIDSLDVQRDRQGRSGLMKGEKAKAEKEKEATEEKPAPAEGTEDIGVPRGLVKTFKVLNSITPRTNDLDTLTTMLIAKGLVSEAEQKKAERDAENVEWAEVILVSGLWIAFFLGLAMLRFTTRSY